MMSIEHQTSNAEREAASAAAASVAERPDDICSDCIGSGQCAICEGSGMLAKQNEFERLENVTCESCSGEGACPACGGTGVVGVPVEKTL